jgi:hypothetical protein
LRGEFEEYTGGLLLGWLRKSLFLKRPSMGAPAETAPDTSKILLPRKRKSRLKLLF